MTSRVVSYMWSVFVAQWPTIASHTEAAIERIRVSELSDAIRDLSSFSLRMFLRFMQLMTALVLLLTSASAVYACVYYVIMPTKILQRPLYFDYGVHSLVLHANEHVHYTHRDNPAASTIQLPTATLDLTTGATGRDQWTYIDPDDAGEADNRGVLTPGAKYDVVVDLELAESDTNVDIGMFMVRTEVLSPGNVATARSARPVFVRPGHWVVDLSARLVWLFPTLALGHHGHTSQAQSILAINGYKDLRHRPLTAVRVELSHPRVQIVRASLSIVAQLSGLRYLMYHWFALTSTIAIANIACAEVFWCFVLYLYLTCPPVDQLDDASNDDDIDQDEQQLEGLASDDGADDDSHDDSRAFCDPDDATIVQAFDAAAFTPESTAHLRQRQSSLQRAAKAI
ncbi:hypothetical protein H310_07479 [Aphanomyces invadans]|uniref:Seipin n=1 Tax=Aphanomyces invadans TaxID=157072 RepID=A0A024U2C7_9STRA|nr:hypothetical protein H310_07479 [Aphanomyces invadans]ETW00047.1 hypothetical protein H310_07479 [Aphanomyces invadans]|eukprot:XP_008871072.1 hypothetical protein H310_07479 [Aphanomyces invadans]